VRNMPTMSQLTLKALNEASPEAAAWGCANAPNFVPRGPAPSLSRERVHIIV